jgi:16S rRNA (guanine1207-N2)-methyltransferase
MEHYYNQDPQGPSDEKMIKVELAGQKFAFFTDRAVFARDRLDYGTRLLLESCLRECGDWTGRVLDLGCGYGAIGIIIKKMCSRLQVTLLDINKRALGLARRNLALNQVGSLELIHADGLTGQAGHYDVIVTNPPVRTGKKTVYRLFRQAEAGLAPGGRLYLVIQKKQGAASARQELASLFNEVDIIARSAGFQVIRCCKNIPFRDNLC